MARLCTSPARFGAAHHRLVLSHRRTILGAAVAHFGAGAAGKAMQIRTADHEVRAGSTYLDAVEKKPDMIRYRMLPTLTETVLNRARANLVTVETFLDAAIHRVTACLPLASGRAGLCLLDHIEFPFQLIIKTMEGACIERCSP